MPRWKRSAIPGSSLTSGSGCGFTVIHPGIQYCVPSSYATPFTVTSITKCTSCGLAFEPSIADQDFSSPNPVIIPVQVDNKMACHRRAFAIHLIFLLRIDMLLSLAITSMSPPCKISDPVLLSEFAPMD